MKIPVTVLILFILFLNRLSAQQENILLKNYLGIGIGYSFDAINDENFSPLNQKGNTLIYSILYERRANDVFKISLQYGSGLLQSGPSNKTFKTDYYSGSIGITYLKNLSSMNQSTNFFIGGEYKLRLIYMDWFDQDAFSYLSTNGLSLAGGVSKLINKKHLIESTLSIPFIQFLGRPPYNGIDNNIIENQDEPIKILLDSEFVSFKKYKAINWNVNYNYEISKHFDCRLDYALNIEAVNDINKFTQVSNTILTSIIYKF